MYPVYNQGRVSSFGGLTDAEWIKCNHNIEKKISNIIFTLLLFWYHIMYPLTLFANNYVKNA